MNKLLVRHFSWLKLFEIQPSTFEESCGVALVREFSRIVFLELDKTKAVFFARRRFQKIEIDWQMKRQLCPLAVTVLDNFP